MSEENKQFKNDSVGLWKTTYRTGKLAGKEGYRGTIDAEQYNELVAKLAPGSTIFLNIVEKKNGKSPDFRLTIAEPLKKEDF